MPRSPATTPQTGRSALDDRGSSPVFVMRAAGTPLRGDGRFGLWVLAVFLLAVALITVRAWSTVAYPNLDFEDGTILYAHHVGQPDPARVFQFYAGYISLGPNIAAYAVCNAAPRLAPYLMPVISIAIAAAACTAFSLRRFRCIVPGDGARMAVCIVLAALPLGDAATCGLLSYSLWNLLILALLLTAAPLPASPLARSGQFAFTAVAIWSHPLSVVLAPLCLACLWLRRSRAERIYHGGLILVVVSYVALGVRPDEGGSALSVGAAALTPRLLLDRVVFESFSGSAIRASLHRRGLDVVVTAGGMAAAALLGVALVMIRRRLSWAHVKALALAAMVLVSLTFLGVAGRGMTLEQGLGTSTLRYFYAQQFFFVLLVGAAAALALRGRAGEGHRAPLAAAGAAALAAVVLVQNAFDHRYFLTDRRASEGTVAFAREVARRLAEPPDRRPAGAMVLVKDGVWDIHVDFDPPPPEPQPD